MATPIEPNAIYLPDEVADILRCSPANVYALLKSGQLASVKVGSKKSGLRVKGSDIFAFIESRTTGGPKPVGYFKNLKFPKPPG